LDFLLDRDPAGRGELFELGVEIAAAEAPDAAEVFGERLVEIVAMFGASHQETEEGRLR
jgi:Asp-tRNA(Asn)/Glu-tRNA(Gln) amidotransferase B subunit